MCLHANLVLGPAMSQVEYEAGRPDIIYENILNGSMPRLVSGSGKAKFGICSVVWNSGANMDVGEVGAAELAP